jgi:hypothetical protein
MVDETVVYGRHAKREAESRKLARAKSLAPGTAADRAGFAGKSGRGASRDLVDDVKDKKVKVEDLKKDELPPELAKLKTVKERKEYLKKKAKKRAELNKKAIALDKKRTAYIAAELKKKGKKGSDSFDSQVLTMLRKQAKKFKIKY